MLVEMPEGATRDGEPWPAKGEDAELPTAAAAHLVASGVAEEVVEQAATEPRQGRRKTTDGQGE